LTALGWSGKFLVRQEVGRLTVHPFEPIGKSSPDSLDFPIKQRYGDFKHRILLREEDEFK